MEKNKIYIDSDGNYSVIRSGGNLVIKPVGAEGIEVSDEEAQLAIEEKHQNRAAKLNRLPKRIRGEYQEKVSKKAQASE